MKKKLIIFSILTTILLMSFQGFLFSQEIKKDDPQKVEKYKSEPLKISGFVDVIGVVRSGQAKRQLGHSYMNLYLATINLDGAVKSKDSDFALGYHVDLRFSAAGLYGNGKSRKNYAAYDSPLFLEEGYIYASLPFGKLVESKLKVGSVYVPFGLQGDNSWYFTLAYYAGLTSNADYGLVSDSTIKISKSFGLQIALGYFLNDDRQSGARNGGFSDVTIDGDISNGNRAVEEQSKFVGRLVGMLSFGPIGVNIGGSIMMGKIENLAGGSTNEDTKQQLFEGDIDFNAKFGKFGVRLLGEIISADRNKDNVSLLSGNNNKKFTLWLAGLTLSYEVGSAIKSVSIYGNYSQLSRSNNSYTSNLLVIGGSIQVIDPLTINIEYINGKYDKSKSITSTYSGGNNRFDEGLYMNATYTY